jgi:nucleoside-diphosphate-sugar epimerase
MNILFIGGTGNISTACTELSLKSGYSLTLLNRSLRAVIPGVETLTVDITNIAAVTDKLKGRHFDVVVDFIAFNLNDIEARLELFRGKTDHYIFISTASAYQKPLQQYLITESTPLSNPFWEYSRCKIDCEVRLMEAYRNEVFPVTIVRPSLTYGDSSIPLAVNSGYTSIDRMRSGKPLIIPGDGLSLWTITHNSDFAKGLVGLCGKKEAIGEAFHITSDEVLTWNQIYSYTAEAAGIEEPRFIHISSDLIAACIPAYAGSLLGDKSHSAVFDNSKIKRLVPEFKATTRFKEGIARSLAWFDAEPKRKNIDYKGSALSDKLIQAYERGASSAIAEFKC